MLGRVVGEQSHRTNAGVREDLRSGAVVTGVCGKTELQVGVHGVRAVVLKLVGLQLVHQPDAASLVPSDIEDDAATLGSNGRQCRIELRSAVAAQ